MDKEEDFREADTNMIEIKRLLNYLLTMIQMSAIVLMLCVNTMLYLCY